MRRCAATIISLSLLAWACAPVRTEGAAAQAGPLTASTTVDAATIRIVRGGTQHSRKAPIEYFTGSVRIDPLFETRESSHTCGAYVTFEPGARSAWHTHPLGQILLVTAGAGRVQRWGGPVEEMRQGDVVWIPAGIKHWHGAAPTTGLTTLGIQEHRAGRSVDWLEEVSDVQYGEVVQAAPITAGPAPAPPILPGQPTRAQQLMSDIAPKLAELTDRVLYGDVWARPDLSPRDRSLVTVSALIALNRPDQLRSHLARAGDNGVTRAEIIETITHLAFYAGWPNAVTAIGVAREVFQKK